MAAVLTVLSSPWNTACPPGCWPPGHLAGWPAGWLAGWLAGWPAASLACWLNASLDVSQAATLAASLAASSPPVRLPGDKNPLQHAPRPALPLSRCRSSRAGSDRVVTRLPSPKQISLPARLPADNADTNAIYRVPIEFAVSKRIGTLRCCTATPPSCTVLAPFLHTRGSVQRRGRNSRRCNISPSVLPAML